ncbi:uncharacterized, partial [Tachysurus ichikawai]
MRIMVYLLEKGWREERPGSQQNRQWFSESRGKLVAH